MKFVIGVDDDGHFIIEALYEREKVLKLIQGLQDGDLFANSEFHDQNIFINDFTKDEYMNFVYSFVQRGLMEIVNMGE